MVEHVNIFGKITLTRCFNSVFPICQPYPNELNSFPVFFRKTFLEGLLLLLYFFYASVKNLQILFLFHVSLFWIYNWIFAKS